ncbi:YihY/virulence factor BrkB family protein [Halapricum salinum]|uniref:YihY/virulence factor BrkB family protein n=1 Tax=Halapricum salinum TaxID=1457250 RepID=A0A4D6HG63_9EURY|nr:YhjD/YihY/BrkB family envelope integrity protein [Halapricum salinum]QCC52032.1 YihY/virulence factor BrkB family protein [Halapricum salinum]
MGLVGDAASFLKAVALTAYREEIRYPAAALAYYGFVSFVPLLLLVVAVLGDQLTTQLARIAPTFLTPEVSDLIDQSLQTATHRISAGLLAVFVLVWSGVNFVGDVRAVVERIEGESRAGVHAWIRDAIGILGSIGAAILTITTTTVIFAYTGRGPLDFVAAFGSLWLLLTIMFLPLYVLPSTAITKSRDALPGATTTAFCWTVIHTGIQFYAINAGQFSVYGVLSGVLLILTSLYLAAATLFTGFIVNFQYHTNESPLGRR